MNEVTVWHDGSCPLCAREVALMRWLDTRGAINFVDATTADADTCPLDRRDLLARFHAKEGDTVLSGAAASYRALIGAGLAHDRDRIREIAVETEFLGAHAATVHRASVDRIIAAIDDAMGKAGPFDFGDRAFVPVVREEARSLLEDRGTWHVPDVETLFVQRKVSGTALLAARLKAQVDVTSLAADAIG